MESRSNCADKSEPLAKLLGLVAGNSILAGRERLRRVLSSYFQFHHQTRTHPSLDKDCPCALAGCYLFLFAQGPDRIIDIATKHQCDNIIIVDINKGRYPSAEQIAIEKEGMPFLALPRDADDEEIRRLISHFIETKLMKSNL